MHSKDATTRTAGTLSHPPSTEWMELLYDEAAPARKEELLSHLSDCPACAAHFNTWRETMQGLDKYELPAGSRHRNKLWAPVFRFAAAAAIVLAAGFALGRRQTAPAAEIENLKNSVAQLALMVQAQEGSNWSNTLFAATAAANEETMRMLTDFSRQQEQKQAADRQIVGLTLQSFETRLAQVRRELETVAVNTQTGFQETRQNLSQLVSYSLGQTPNQK